MRRGRGPRSLALLLLLLAVLPGPGHGNEGSVAGSCYCDKTISSDSPPRPPLMAHFRKQLKVYHRCSSYIRFQLQHWSVCGGSKDPWVQQLMNCFDLRECGRVAPGSVASQKHLPPPSTQVPEPTETAPLDVGSPAQTHQPPTMWSTQGPTLAAGAPSSDEKLTRTNETAPSTVGHGLSAGEKRKQLEDHVGPAAGTGATVPVVALLAIVFLLTIVLLYVTCKKRRERSLQHSPDPQCPYTRVASASSA